jgi:hypothetical protein
MGPQKDSDRSKAKRKIVRTTIEVKKKKSYHFPLTPSTLLSTDKVTLNFRLYFIYLLCLFFLFKILCIFIVFEYDFMHEVLL